MTDTNIHHNISKLEMPHYEELSTVYFVGLQSSDHRFSEEVGLDPTWRQLLITIWPQRVSFQFQGIWSPAKITTQMESSWPKNTGSTIWLKSIKMAENALHREHSQWYLFRPIRHRCVDMAAVRPSESTMSQGQFSIFARFWVDNIYTEPKTKTHFRHFFIRRTASIVEA